jgi:hypothetical protein
MTDEGIKRHAYGLMPPTHWPKQHQIILLALLILAVAIDSSRIILILP